MGSSNAPVRARREWGFVQGNKGLSTITLASPHDGNLFWRSFPRGSANLRSAPWCGRS